jgi:hypothetical protein
MLDVLRVPKSSAFVARISVGIKEDLAIPATVSNPSAKRQSLRNLIRRNQYVHFLASGMRDGVMALLAVVICYQNLSCFDTGPAK